MNSNRAGRLVIQLSMCRHRASEWVRRFLSVRAFGTVLALGAALLLLSGTGASAAGKIALVLAAEDYQKLQKSSVGLKRGNEIAEALTARGFEVTLSTNPSNATARANLRDFSDKAEGAEIALVVLIGHGTTWGGQSFFLTTNTEVGRATDLLSRALSIASIAQIAGRAANGGVFFFMTTPTFGSAIEGLDARPQFTGEIAKNAFVVFSSSSKVPVSRVDAMSEQAAEAFAKLLQQPDPALSEAVKAASNGNLGLVVGTAADINLSKPPTPAPAPAAPATLSVSRPPVDAERKTEMEGRLEAERQARELAERRIRAEQLKAEQAQAEAQKAQADAARAQAEAERARQEAKRIEAQALLARAQAEAAKPTSAGLPINDELLGQRQRQVIQERLRKLGLYTGAIDSIMGPLTREAIMGYQKSRGAAVTGYLTPDQYEALLADDSQ